MHTFFLHNRDILKSWDLDSRHAILLLFEGRLLCTEMIDSVINEQTKEYSV